MSSPVAPLLLADLFDRYRLPLLDSHVNALTPIWILCVGAMAGLLLTGALWGLLRLAALVPGVGTLSEQPVAKRIAIAVLTFLLFGVAVAGYAQMNRPLQVAGAVAAPVKAAQPLDSWFGWAFAAGVCWLIA